MTGGKPERVIIGTPSEKQKEFLLAREKYICFGGARGGGKSWAVRTKAKLLAIRYPGIRMLIVRRTYPELINNHVSFLRPELSAVAKYLDKDKSFRFENGSCLNLAYCSSDADLDRLQGVEYDVIFIDEATQLSEHQIRVITACVRGANSFPKRVYMTCNPGGQGMQFIKRLFVDRRYEAGERPEDYRFIRSLVTDNHALMAKDPDYIRQLEQLPPKLRDAWLNGSWDVYEGQFFEEFADKPEHYADRQWTHVIDPFDIPANWTILRGFDWGYSRPFSVVWCAVDPDGCIYHFLEMYGCTKTPNEGVKWTPERVFAEIRKTELEHPWLSGRHITGIADPAIWDAERGESIAEVAARNQVYFSPGDHKRIPGWVRMHHMMRFDDNGFPMLYVFRNCRHFIRTIPLLMYDEHKPEDLDTNGEDHAADAMRYLLMSRPIAPRMPAEDDGYENNPLNVYLDIPRGGAGKAGSAHRMEIING